MWAGAHAGELEVVFVSRDRDQAGFDEYFATMPWPAVPFDDHWGRDRLAREYDLLSCRYKRCIAKAEATGSCVFLS